MASLAQIFASLLMAALLLVGQAAQAGACLCHGHGEPGAVRCESVAACPSGAHEEHGAQGDGCTCACHDLSNRAADAVGTAVGVSAPLFVPHPCVSDLPEVFSLLGLDRPEPVGPPEAVFRHALHRGFVCPLRS